MRLPRPVRPRSISAARMLLYAYMPAAMSAIEQPALAGSSARAGDRQEPGLALDQQVVGLLVAVRPGPLRVVAVAGDVADDELRMRRVQRLERQAHARRRAGREVLHEHVGAGEQALERAPAASACLRSSVRLSLPRLVQTKCDDRPLTRPS